MELLAGTGIRVSELCDLRAEHIDLKLRVIKIVKSSKVRNLKIEDDEIIIALRNYMIFFDTSIKLNDFFFISRIQKRLPEQSVRVMVKKYSEQAGYIGVTPFNFRRSFAVNQFNQSTDILNIQRVLGHSTIVLTQNLAATNEAPKETVAVVERLRHTDDGAGG